MSKDGTDPLPTSDADWHRLVERRKDALRGFLTWAADRESGGESLRLENREDLKRIKKVLRLFDERWWGTVVYTCFDSELGTQEVAPEFKRPIPHRNAERKLKAMKLPSGSIQHHRTQPGHRGAKIALVSACAKAEDFREILHEGDGFHARYEALIDLDVPQWRRTTCFDLLIRAGVLGVAGKRYRPDGAYLYGSTGPSKGFTAVWGIEVTAENADRCEELLRGWSKRWSSIAEQVGVRWVGAPYDSGDFENALCIYQESGPVGCGGRNRVC